MYAPLWRKDAEEQDDPFNWEFTLGADLVRDIPRAAHSELSAIFPRLSHQASAVLCAVMKGRGPPHVGRARRRRLRGHRGTGPTTRSSTTRWASAAPSAESGLEAAFDAAADDGGAKAIAGAEARLRVFAPAQYDARQRTARAASGADKIGWFAKNQHDLPPVKE